jgi:hypothetical protein
MYTDPSITVPLNVKNVRSKKMVSGVSSPLKVKNDVPQINPRVAQESEKATLLPFVRSVTSEVDISGLTNGRQNQKGGSDYRLRRKTRGWE